MRKRRHLLFWILFPIGWIASGALLLFYIDLANGPSFFLAFGIFSILALAATSLVLLEKKKGFRAIPWGAFLINVAIIVAFARPSVVTKSAAYYDNPVAIEHSLLTHNGKIQGVYNEDKSVEIYAGIPYAEAPVGELRWKEPVPVKNWDGVRDCSKFAPRAMQVDSPAIIDSLVDIYSEKGWHPDYNEHPLQNMSEDCLYLNVWKPVDASNAPILIYVHGGSLESGSSAYEAYNGEAMAKQGVIMVTIAYRLGVFGYLSLPELAEESPNGTTGNYGLLDQIEAVNWVYENAECFGGDKTKITVAGESAGSSSISALCTTPLLRGSNKILRAIGESSSIVGKYPPHTFRPLKDAYEAGEKFKKEQGDLSLSELRKIDAKKLVKSAIPQTSMTLDGYALDKMPNDVYLAKENNESYLLNGYNIKEADAFVIPTFLFSPTSSSNFRERLLGFLEDEATVDAICKVYAKRIEEDAFSALNEVLSALWFMYPHYEWSHLAQDNGEAVYRYQFTKENGYRGSYHSGELVYCYGNIKLSGHSFAYGDKDYALQDAMLAYWANFVKTGDPNGGSLPTWPNYESGTEKVMELGENVGVIDEKYLNLYPVFASYVPPSYKG